MNRRSACIGLLAAVNASLALAAQGVARIAGARWNVNGDWTPSIEEIQRHLRNLHGIDPGGLGLEDMLVLHDNSHNRMGRGHGHSKGSKRVTKGYSKA